MATRNYVFGSTNGDKEIDLIDIGALALLPTAAALLFETITFSVSVFGGYEFTDPLWTVGGSAISVALLVVVFAVAWIFFTNIANEETELGEYEKAAVIVTLALPLLYVFVPAVGDLIGSSDYFRVAATLWVSIGSVVISYIG